MMLWITKTSFMHHRNWPLLEALKLHNLQIPGFAPRWVCYSRKPSPFLWLSFCRNLSNQNCDFIFYFLVFFKIIILEGRQVIQPICWFILPVPTIARGESHRSQGQELRLRLGHEWGNLTTLAIPCCLPAAHEQKMRLGWRRGFSPGTLIWDVRAGSSIFIMVPKTWNLMERPFSAFLEKLAFPHFKFYAYGVKQYIFF